MRSNFQIFGAETHHQCLDVGRVQVAVREDARLMDRRWVGVAVSGHQGSTLGPVRTSPCDHTCAEEFAKSGNAQQSPVHTSRQIEGALYPI